MAKLRNWKVAHGLGWVCAVGGAAVCLGGVRWGWEIWILGIAYVSTMLGANVIVLSLRGVRVWIRR